MKMQSILCLWLAALLMCSLAQTTNRSAIQPEPKYGGKTLSEWAEIGLRSDSTASDHQQAVNIIYTVGSNAIPTVLRWLAAKDSPTNHLDAEFWNEAAQKAFGMLCSVPAGHQVPESKLTNAAEEVVKIYKQNISESSRRAACAILYFLDGAIDPAAKSAMPQLFQDATNTMTPIGHDAILALANIRSEAAVTVPFFTNALHNAGMDDSVTQMAVLEALGNLGTNARAAIPVLHEFEKRTDTIFQSMATEALEKIEPEHAAKESRSQ
jgi:hypothetical protein